MTSFPSLRRTIAAFKDAQKITNAMKMTAVADHEISTTDQESNLIFNRTSQTTITKELMNIVSGSWALQ